MSRIRRIYVWAVGDVLRRPHRADIGSLHTLCGQVVTKPCVSLFGANICLRCARIEMQERLNQLDAAIRDEEERSRD